MISSTATIKNFLPVIQSAKKTKTGLSSGISSGVVTFGYLDGDADKGYYLYRPNTGYKHNALFVTIHGISRNAYEHVLRFIPYAEQYGVTIVAPLFSKTAFSRYQRMGQTKTELRTDKYFDAIIAQVSRLTEISADKFYLFGYSGGAQFAHRYMMAYPERVISIAIGAAGWYTFPDAGLTYPAGIKQAPFLHDLTFQPEKFLKIPTLVLVGEKDIERDKALRKSKKIDRLQGLNRLERGKAWIDALNNCSRQLGMPSCHHSFIQLPGSDHSFRRCIRKGGMADHIFRHFFRH